MNKYEKRIDAANKKRKRIELPKAQRVKLDYLAEAAKSHGISEEYGTGVDDVDGDKANFVEAALDVERLVKRLNDKIKKLEAQVKGQA